MGSNATLKMMFNDDDDRGGKRRRRQYSIEPADMIAIGILILAIAAALIAVIVALGFVFGKVNGADAAKIIGLCVGGSTISGIVAALVGRKRKG
jgi:hypothetical protein